MRTVSHSEVFVHIFKLTDSNSRRCFSERQNVFHVEPAVMVKINRLFINENIPPGDRLSHHQQILHVDSLIQIAVTDCRLFLQITQIDMPVANLTLVICRQMKL